MSRVASIERTPKKRAVLEKDKLSKKSSIINAAAFLLQKKDWSQLSMDEVAKRAKIAKGTLYLYFPTKEDLCLRVHNIDYEAWFRDLIDYLVSNPKVTPEKFANWFVDSMNNHPRFLKLLPIVPTILEKNASIETIREFKTNLRNQILEVIPLLISSLNFPNEEASFFFLMQCHALAVGSWSHGFPSANVKEALNEQSLNIFMIDYVQFVKRSVLTLILGQTK
ncbi:TetR family transcriptional regulator [Leptospira sp. 96542]|nr:TetR family transcriptional regulator [Leptospira sp. 96542]